MKRMFMLLALLGLIWSGPAAAQSVKNVLDDFGYVGRWAANCGQAASGGNPLLIVSILPSGVGEHRYDFGPGSTPEINTIFGAKRSDADKITLKIRFRNGNEREQIIVKMGGKIRTMSYRRTDGTFMTKDGIILSNGNPTLSLSRCR